MAILNTPLLGLPYAGADTDETYDVLAGLFVKDGKKQTLPEIVDKYTPTIGTVYIEAADWTAADGTADAYDAKITISGVEPNSMILLYPESNLYAEKAKRLGIRAKAASGVANDDTFVIVRATGGDPTVTDGIGLVYIALRGYAVWSAGLTPPALPYATVIGVDPYIATEEGDRDDIAASQRLVTRVAEAIRKSVDDLAKTAIDKTVNDLVNYYNKSQTLTKDEINALVSAIPKFKIEVVTSLPASNISETTVYLVKSGDDDTNLYTEYIRTGDKWEKLGTQTVDLTGYATEAWVNDILAAYVKTVDMEAYVAEVLAGYLTKEEANKTYQPKGDYLTPTAAAPIINTEVNKVVTERKEELRGDPGETPEAGVDYPTKEQIDSYIAAELSKRNQFVPIPAASVEDMTDTTKIYYLTATGELYAYAPAQVVVGGYTNLADPASSDWKTRSRLNASAVISSASAEADRSFVSNQIPATNGQTVRIKGVTATTNTAGTATNFTAVLYDSSGTQLNTKPFILKQPVSGSGFSTDTSHQSWNAVHVTDDGVYEWELGLNNGGGVPHPSVASFRISGLAVTSAEDIIITVGQEIKDPEIVTKYAWAGTGHFISSEGAVTALESRVNELEDEVEELTVTVDRLKTNSSISMQSGAVWYALGDSITQGYASRVNASATNGYDQYVAAEGKRWVDYVAALNGYTLTNYGVGGTGYAHRTDNARAQVDGINFSGCDLVTLAYGINDFKNAGTNIGSMDDDIQAGGSFVSNMRYCIKKILADNPLCKIIVITPLNYRGLGTYASNYSIGYTGDNASCANLDYMVDLMEQVCLYHGIEMIDMTHSSIVARDNIVTMLPDYVHPSEECHRVLGYELARKINFA